MVRKVLGVLWLGIALAVPRVATAQSEQVYYYLLDALGSVRAITDATNQIVERHDYLPFGEAPPGEPAGQDAHRVAGKERDSDTGFDYFGGRYYASGNGRFTSVDPVLDQQKALGDPQQWNRYAYVRNNPLKFVDPDGREIFLAIAPGVTETNRSIRSWLYNQVSSMPVVAPVTDFLASVLWPVSHEETQRSYEIALSPASTSIEIGSAVVRDVAAIAAREVRTPTAGYLQHLTRNDLVGAAREVASGVAHGGQHLKEVSQAARGLRGRIDDIIQGLSNPRLSLNRRAELEQELGIASRYLDAAEQALKGRYPLHEEGW